MEQIVLSGDTVSLMVHEDCSSTDSKSSSFCIDRVDEPISYERFFLHNLVPNRPCVFGPFLTEGWPSRRDWVGDDGLPAISYLRDHFGDVTVPVANCEQVQYDAQPKEDMLLRDYLQYWEEQMRQGQRSDKRCLYMKDMHFTRDCPSYQAYDTPIYFTSDWLNEFWDTRTDCDEDDYRFLYMGPKGSWTPFHADVFRSYSWSANVCGSKRWILVPPGQEVYLRDRLGNIPYDVTSCNFRNAEQYPNFKDTSYTPIEVVQSAGEVIFVPSGWHHQVFNLEDTISINHNWFNGASVAHSWGFLQRELSKVQKSISDCRNMEGWEQQCQLILKASTGMDYQEFFQLLVCITRRRSEVISRSLNEKLRAHSERIKNKTEIPSSNNGAEFMKSPLTQGLPNDSVGSTTHEGSQIGGNIVGQPKSVMHMNQGGNNVTESCGLSGDKSNDAYSIHDLSGDDKSNDAYSTHCLSGDDKSNNAYSTHDLSADMSNDAYSTYLSGNDNLSNHAYSTLDLSGDKSHTAYSSHDACSLQTQDHKLMSRSSRECPHWRRSLTYWHAVYDLHHMARVMNELTNDADFQLLDISAQGKKPKEVIKEITDTLSKVKLS